MLYVKNIIGDNLRNYIQFKRSPLVESYEWKMYPRKVLTLSKIENTIHYANDFYDDGDIHRDLLLLADGFTLYYQDEINAPYLYAWMMIETFITERLGEICQNVKQNKRLIRII